jgi:ferric-dicitrate binding protein FerR (iron transport regulator)
MTESPVDGRAGGPSQFMDSFVSLARRSSWSLSRGQRTLAWHRLQTARGAASSAGSTGNVSGRNAAGGGFFGSHPQRLAFRTLMAVGAICAVLAPATWVLVQRTGYHPWQQALKLNALDSEAVRAVGLTDGPGELTFSDGTRIGVGTTSKIALDALTVDGANVRLVRGAIDVHVRPRSNAHWVFNAGPFRVNVKGTAFNLEWQPKEERFSLKMWTGVVVLQGRNGRDSLTVRAGESVALAGSDDLARISKTSSFGAESPPPGDVAAESSAGGHPGDVEAQPSPSTAPASSSSSSRKRLGARREERDQASSRDSWSSLLEHGAFTEIVEQAQRRGVESVLQRGAVADLTTLADAARYTQQNQLAHRALLALRTRFPETDRAKNSAFFLGRLGESANASTEKVLDWYERYLHEAPHGPYEEGALTREMVLLRAQKSWPRARLVAERYMREYPTGTYRDLAVSLAGSEVR